MGFTATICPVSRLWTIVPEQDEILLVKPSARTGLSEAMKVRIVQETGDHSSSLLKVKILRLRRIIHGESWVGQVPSPLQPKEAPLLLPW
jgi:hypothetical protein